MKLNKIVKTFTKTVDQLEKFVSQTDQQIDDFEHEKAYAEGRINELSAERKTALQIKSKIEELIS